MMRKLYITIFFVLAACVTTPFAHPAWNITGVKPKVDISAPKFLKDRVAFVVTATNDTDETFCFDGVEDYPMGLLMYHAETSADFSWTSLFAEDKIREIGPVHFAGPPIVRRQLFPHSSISVTVQVGAPLTGSFYTPGPDPKYKKSDPLVAKGGTYFYDCSYPTEGEATAAGRSFNIISKPTAPFRER